VRWTVHGERSIYAGDELSLVLVDVEILVQAGEVLDGLSLTSILYAVAFDAI
jgi:hypothetical protein